MPLSRQCQQKAGAMHQLKMPQYGADKDSLIVNTSDNGTADNVEDVDDGEEDITKKYATTNCALGTV